MIVESEVPMPHVAKFRVGVNCRRRKMNYQGKAFENSFKVEQWLNEPMLGYRVGKPGILSVILCLHYCDNRIHPWRRS